MQGLIQSIRYQFAVDCIKVGTEDSNETQTLIQWLQYINYFICYNYIFIRPTATNQLRYILRFRLLISLTLDCLESRRVIIQSLSLIQLHWFKFLQIIKKTFL